MNLQEGKNKKRLIKQKTLFTEVRQEYIQEQQHTKKTFNLEEYLLKTDCSSIFFGHTKIEQKCYTCLK